MPFVTTLTFDTDSNSSSPVREDIGVNIKINQGASVVGATSLNFEVEKPSGTIVNWTPTITTTYLQYTSVAGDLNEVGDYRISSQFVLSGFTGSSRLVTMNVADKFEAQ